MVDTANPLLNVVGPESTAERYQEVRRRAELEETTPVSEELKAAIRALPVSNLAVDLDRWAIPADPNWDWKTYQNELPQRHWASLAKTRSQAEADALIGHVKQADADRDLLASTGLSGTVAQFAAGVVDPLTYVAWANSPLKLSSRMGLDKLVGRPAGVLRGGVQGAEAGAAYGAADYLASPVMQAHDLIDYVMMGGVLGGGFGAATPLTKLDKLRNDYAEAVKAGKMEPPPRDTTRAPTQEQINSYTRAKATITPEDASVGAAAAGEQKVQFVEDTPTPPGMWTDPDPTVMRGFLDDMQWDPDIAGAYEAAGTLSGKVARAVHTATLKLGFAEDWTRLGTSKSLTAQALAAIMDAPSRVYNKNSKTHTALAQEYMNRINTGPAIAYSTAYGRWRKDMAPEPRFDSKRGVDLGSGVQNKILSSTLNAASIAVNPVVRGAKAAANKLHDYSPGTLPLHAEQFNREVMLELADRYHGRVSKQSPSHRHEAIRELADEFDNAYGKHATEILRGREGEIPVFGAEVLEPKSGWFRQVWSGKRIDSIIENLNSRGLDGKGLVKQALVRSYMGNANLTEEYADTIATAVLRRAAYKSAGLDTNIFRVLDDEGMDFVREMLTDAGTPASRVDKIMNFFRDKSAEKNTLNTLKHRNDIDASDIIYEDIRLVDMLETDIMRVHTDYSRRVAFTAASARWGIQRHDRLAIINKILKEDNENGGNLTKDALVGMLGFLDGRPQGGGVSRPVRLVNAMASISLLPQLMFPQLAEFSIAAATYGFKNAMREFMREAHHKELFTTRTGTAGKGTAAQQQLADMGVAIHHSNALSNEVFPLEDVYSAAGDFGAHLGTMEKIVGTLGDMQSAITLFNAARTAEVRATHNLIMQQLYRWAKNPELIDEVAARQIGFGEKQFLALKDILTNEKYLLRDHDDAAWYKQMFGTDPSGNIIGLRYDMMEPETRSMLSHILTRGANQVVQKAMAGEDMYWMHKDLGSFLVLLRGYPIVSIKKQLLRGALRGDTYMMYSLMYGILFGGATWTARAALNGRDITPEDAVRGAISQNPMAAILPLWGDPLVALLGLPDAMRINQFSTGVDSNIFAGPPQIEVLNRLLNTLQVIPSIPFDLATGEDPLTNADIYALKALPMVNHVVMAAGVWQFARD